MHINNGKSSLSTSAKIIREAAAETDGKPNPGMKIEGTGRKYTLKEQGESIHLRDTRFGAGRNSTDPVTYITAKFATISFKMSTQT
jgi:hypothetical protein